MGRAGEILGGHKTNLCDLTRSILSLTKYSLILTFPSLYSDIKLPFPEGAMVKNLPANAGDAPGSIPESERFPGGGNGNPLEYACQKNPMDSGAWRATVHVVSESDTTEGLSMYAC